MNQPANHQRPMWKILKEQLGSEEYATSAIWQKLEARDEMNQLQDALYDYHDLLAELDAVRDGEEVSQRLFLGR